MCRWVFEYPIKREFMKKCIKKCDEWEELMFCLVTQLLLCSPCRRHRATLNSLLGGGGIHLRANLLSPQVTWALLPACKFQQMRTHFSSSWWPEHCSPTLVENKMSVRDKQLIIQVMLHWKSFVKFVWCVAQESVYKTSNLLEFKAWSCWLVLFIKRR